MSKYRLGNEIGRGGMGIVFSAWEIAEDGSETPVVIKRLLPEHSNNPAVIARFCHEAKLCKELGQGHANLVPVSYFGRDHDNDGQWFMVMERLPGLSLDRLVAAGVLKAVHVRRIMREIADALAYLHDRGVLHRDVSPRNIVVTQDGAVKLLDLGLAKLRDSPLSDMNFKGTAVFASPEALHNGELGPSSDLYSLAAAAYYLITNEPPYGFGDVMQLIRRVSIRTIKPLGETVPEDLREAIMGLLRFVEKRQPQDARALAGMLGEDEPGVAEELGELVRPLRAMEKGQGVIEAAGGKLAQVIEPKPERSRARWPALAEPVMVLLLLLLVARPEPVPPSPEVAARGAKAIPVTVDPERVSHEPIVPDTKDVQTEHFHLVVVQPPTVTPVTLTERAPHDASNSDDGKARDARPGKRKSREDAAQPRRFRSEVNRKLNATSWRRDLPKPWETKRW